MRAARSPADAGGYVITTRQVRRLAAAIGAATALVAAISAAQDGRTAVPRLAPIAEAQWTDEQRKVAAQFAASGMTNAIATYLHHPALAQMLLAHQQYLYDDSVLPPRHRLLLQLRTAWLTRSDYLWAHRAPAAREAGFTNDELTRVARGADATGWDAFEATLLRAADELHVDSFISDPSWRALTARYTTAQMIDVIDTVGGLTMNAGALSSFGVQIESGLTDRRPSGIRYSPSAKRVNVRLVGKEARIPPAPPAKGPDGTVRPTANVFSTFRHNPPADTVRGAINNHVNRNALQPKHRELLLMRIGILCRSEYEYAAHFRAGRRAGMTDGEVESILKGPGSSADAVWNALLRATDELHENDVVAPDTWAVLARAMDAKQLFDVMVSIGGYRSTSMLINSAGVQLDDNMADFRFPPELR
jgi:4-carboxymuconolactone decarboxylase